MDDDAAEVTTILAHARIRDCIVRLARGEDRRDPTLVKDAFWPDATVDFGIFDGTQVIGYHRLDAGPEHRDSVLGGRYLDRFEWRDGRWRIGKRIMLYDWVQDQGVSVDWSQGVMGAPLREEWFIGCAHGDSSEKFFGE